MPTVRKRGAKWQSQVRIKSGGVIVYQESASFDTERQAKSWGFALETKLAREGIDAHLKDQHTVTYLLGEWVKFKESGGTKISRGLQHSVKALMLSPFGTKVASEVTAADLTAWALKLAEKLDPATILHHLMVLRSVFVNAQAISGVRLSLEPLEDAARALKGLKVIGKSTSRERRVTDAELTKIVLHLKGKFLTVPTDLFVLLAVELPRRREELLTMTWDDYTGDTVTLRDTKNPNKPRTEVIPVPPGAKAIIDRLPRIDARILPYRPESVSAAFQRAVKELGLIDLRLHDLRHEGISRLFEQGLAIQEVALISGHLSWAALRRYTHIKPSDVLGKLNARIQKAQEAHPEPA